MRYLLVMGSCILGIFVLTGANAALAAAETQLHGLAQKPGWSGYVGLLVGSYSDKGLAAVRDGNERIESLNAKPGRSDEVYPIVQWQTHYTFSQNTTLSIGIPDDGSAVVALGISHQFADETLLSISYGPKSKLSGAFSDAWQDPYLTGQNRQRADTTLESVGLAAEYIFGSPLSVRYTYSERAIEDDRAGESLNFRLTSAELKQLQRSKKSHNISLAVTLPLGDSFYLIPQASYARTNAEGDANSSAATQVELTLFYQQGRFEVFGSAYAAESEYRKINPVFGAKRKDDGYGGAVGVSYLKPFGWKNISLDLIAGVSRQDSNINFYDSEGELLAAGLTYRY